MHAIDTPINGVTCACPCDTKRRLYTDPNWHSTHCTIHSIDLVSACTVLRTSKRCPTDTDRRHCHRPKDIGYQGIHSLKEQNLILFSFPFSFAFREYMRFFHLWIPIVVPGARYTAQRHLAIPIPIFLA